MEAGSSERRKEGANRTGKTKFVRQEERVGSGTPCKETGLLHREKKGGKVRGKKGGQLIRYALVK